MASTPHEPESSPASPTSPGEILRRSRKQQGIRLEDAAEATKISKTFLLALEEGRFQDLPSQAYLKGFLRTYAAFLRLDTDLLIRQVTDEVDADDTSVPSPAVPRRRSPLDLSGLLQRLALPVLLLFGLLFSSLFIAPDTPPGRLKSLRELAVQKPVQPVISSGIQAVSSSTRLAKPTPATPHREDPTPETTVVLPPREGFMTRMRTTGNCTITVAIDDMAAQAYELTAGDTIEWKAAKQITFELPAHDCIELEHNGVPLKLQGASGRGGYFVLDANGLRP